MDYAFQHIRSLKDVRERLKRHAVKRYKTRSLTHVTHIAVHHSLTTSGSAEAFARYHVTELGWPGIGYHFVIEKDGMVKWCHDPTVKSYHVGNSNKMALGVCLTGDFRSQQPTEKQWKSLYTLLRAVMRDLDIDADNIWGHSEFPGYAWKACPCLDMKEIRATAARRSVSPAAAAGTASAQPNTYTVQPGDRFPLILNRFDHLDWGHLRALNRNLPDKTVQPGQQLTVSGPPNTFHKLPALGQQVYHAMRRKGYAFFETDTKPYNLNIVGIRTNTTEPNRFDDRIVVIWKYENQWTCRVYKATTDPGLYYLQHPLNQAGTAILKEGQYRSTYRLGTHRGYKALQQNRPLTVIRDFDRDDRLTFSGGREQTGMFGINIHRAGRSAESTLVNRWSAGCQVFANPHDFRDFIKLCGQAVNEWGNSFTYTLLHENDLEAV